MTAPEAYSLKQNLGENNSQAAALFPTRQVWQTNFANLRRLKLTTNGGLRACRIWENSEVRHAFGWKKTVH